MSLCSVLESRHSTTIAQLNYYQYFNKNNEDNYKKTYEVFLLNTVDELDIPIINIHKDVFALHPEPL